MSTTTTAITASRPRALNVILIVGRVLFGLIFLAAATAKISGVQMMVAEFAKIGLGQWFRYFTGACEITGALLLIRPMTVFYGAGLLTAVSVGAFIAQAMVLHQDVIHTIVFAVLLSSIAYAYFPQRLRLG